jgi:ATP-dependent exoDNAse (exonuclease V) beta subunit
MSNAKLLRHSACQAIELQDSASGQEKPPASADRGIKVMTMKASKGLGFPMIAPPGVGHLSVPGEDEKEAPRATQSLVIGSVGIGSLRGG